MCCLHSAGGEGHDWLLAPPPEAAAGTWTEQ